MLLVFCEDTQDTRLLQKNACCSV